MELHVAMLICAATSDRSGVKNYGEWLGEKGGGKGELTQPYVYILPPIRKARGGDRSGTGNWRDSSVRTVVAWKCVISIASTTGYPDDLELYLGPLNIGSPPP